MKDPEFPEPVYRYTPAEQKKNWKKFVDDGHWGKPACLCGCWMPLEWDDLDGGTFYLPGHEPKLQRTKPINSSNIPSKRKRIWGERLEDVYPVIIILILLLIFWPN